MNAEMLCDAMNHIDHEFIDAAQRRQPEWDRGRLMGFLSAAACLCLVLTGAMALFVGRPAIAPRPTAAPTSPGSAEVVVVPHWEDMTITRQFPHTVFDGREYFGREAALPADAAGELLGTAALTGRDEYTGEEHRASTRVYAISGISSECAVALKFDADDRYHPYVNSHYKPATLGQFIDDLSLAENLSFGAIDYHFFDDDGDYHYVVYTGARAEDIRALILSHPAAENVREYDNNTAIGRTVMTVSISMELLGYENISLSVTDAGYLTSNLLDTGKAFFIGIDKVNTFTDYVFETCEGRPVVHDYSGPYLPEDAPETVTENAAVSSPAASPMPR